MTNSRTPNPVNTLFSTLHERAKELNCLYRIEEILSLYDVALEDVFAQVIEAIPPGWQFPDCCQAQITYGSDTFESPEFDETPYTQCAEIRVQDTSVGRLCVSYKKPTPESDCGPFMKGEVKRIQWALNDMPAKGGSQSVSATSRAHDGPWFVMSYM